MNPPRKATLVAHTHWDRAWYLPFQRFRMRLVRLIDRLLDILDTEPDFRCFTLDAQMVVLEDYLEIRPERRGDIERFVRSGRLLIGPWYILPDEFLVSPEALIRNLARGISTAEQFGGAMSVGYTPDCFGHVGQLPQILAGFGIDSVVFWRGLGDEGRELGSEFWWAAPDDTRLLAIFLPGTGYGQFSHLGYPVRGDPAEMPFRVEWGLSRLRAGIDEIAPFANTSHLVLMAGVDHEEPSRRLPEIVREANRSVPGLEMRIGTLSDHIDAVLAEGVPLREYQGELRSAAFAYALQQVYSSRMPLKQRNWRCQTLLESYAEPFTGFAEVQGAERQEAFLDLAWRELLRNHPHDDICGCSVDAVHRQMETRFDEVEQIGEQLFLDAIRFLSRRISVGESDAIPLFVFNPGTRPHRGTVSGTLQFHAGHRNIDAFSIRDDAGHMVPHQVVGRRRERIPEVNRVREYEMVDVMLDPPAIPACGYRTLFIGRPEETPDVKLRVRDHTMENELIRVDILRNGTLQVVDLETGHVYRGIHGIEDSEDAGDEYTYSPAPRSETVTTDDAQVSVEPLESGPLRAGFRILHHLDLPISLTDDRQRRSGELVGYKIATDVFLTASDKRIEFVTRVSNVARDHRLRVLFPTSIHTDTVHVDGHFDVLERPVELPEGRDWREPPSRTAHQRAFIDVSDGKTGLAVFNQGLPEYEAMKAENGVSIALTLLRCVGWLSRGDLLTRPGHAGPELPTPGAQCPGEHVFRYAIHPHVGNWEAIVHDAHAYNAPCILVTDRIGEGLLPSDVQDEAEAVWEALPRLPELDVLPPSGSFVRLEPSELILSSVRSARDGGGLVVRCYNPTARPAIGTLSSLWSIQSASAVDFLERDEYDLPVRAGVVEFEVPAKAVRTIRCQVAPLDGDLSSR